MVKSTMQSVALFLQRETRLTRILKIRFKSCINNSVNKALSISIKHNQHDIY